MHRIKKLIEMAGKWNFWREFEEKRKNIEAELCSTFYQIFSTVWWRKKRRCARICRFRLVWLVIVFASVCDSFFFF